MNIKFVILQIHFFLFCLISATVIPSFATPIAILNLAENDTSRVNALYSLGDSLRHTNPRQAILYGKQALGISQQLNFRNGISKAAILTGNGFEKQGIYDSALYYYHIALETNKILNHKVNIGKSLNNIGIIYDLQGSYDNALYYYFHALEIWRLTNNNEGISISLNNIGIIYEMQGKYEKAIDYHKQSMAISEEMNNQEGVSASLHNLGLAYEDLEDYEKATTYYLRSLKLREALGMQNLIAVTLHGLGSVALLQDKFEQALSYNTESLKIFQKIGDVYGEVHALLGLAETYKVTGKNEKGLYYAKTALKLSTQTRIKPEVRSASKILTQLYQQQKNFKKALHYQSLYLAYNDSIFNVEKEKVINALEIARKESENEVLKKENELKEAEIARNNATIRQQSILVIAVSVCLLLVGILTFVLYYANQQKLRHNQTLEQQKKEIIQINEELAILNQELQEQHKTMQVQNNELGRLNAFKDKLFSIISHDFRSPLSSLQGVINLLNANALSTHEIKSVFEGLSDKVRNTTGMLDNLLNWARTQMQRVQVNPTVMDLHALAEENVSLVKLSAYKKGILLENDVPKNLTAFADAEMIRLVLRNLISNAIKFSSLGDRITISAASDGEFVKVSVTDTGEGISAENQKKLFLAGDFTTIGTANEKGTGLGLTLCKDFIEKNKGKIWVESQVKAGSVFNFTLPVQELVFLQSTNQHAMSISGDAAPSS